MKDPYSMTYDDTDSMEREMLRQKRKATVTLSVDEMTKLYDLAEAASVGSNIKCPCCSIEHVKTKYNKIFCSNYKTSKNRNCKDRYWNLVDETRREKNVNFMSGVL